MVSLKRNSKLELVEATGYAVPNSNGVINIYDLDGNREGYVPQ